jgi:hypothetical protein
MFESAFLPLYIAALVISAAAVTAKAWFEHKSVRYQEDTKRLGLHERNSARIESQDVKTFEVEEEP